MMAGEIESSLKGRKELTRNAKIALLISVGKDYHEDKHLASTISLLNDCQQKYVFEKITIAVAGTLQRHNFWTFLAKYSDAELTRLLEDLPLPSNVNALADYLSNKCFTAAKLAEDNYLSRNTVLLKKLTSSTEIVRWNALQAQADYKAECERIQMLYHGDDEFKQAIDKTTEDFLRAQQIQKLNEIEMRMKRIKPALQPLSFGDVARVACRNYLLEECPLIMPLWGRQGYDYIFYPHKITAALDLARRASSGRTPQWVEIYFKHINLQKREEAKVVRGISNNLQVSQKSDVSPPSTVYRLVFCPVFFSPEKREQKKGEAPSQALTPFSEDNAHLAMLYQQFPAEMRRLLAEIKNTPGSSLQLLAEMPSEEKRSFQSRPIC